MPHLNIEIKARCNDHAPIRELLKTHGADFRGTDDQTDTYFKCANGRLKLRQGNIECNLIHYHRPDQAGPKASEVTLFKPGEDHETLRRLLTAAMGVEVVVTKLREISFIDNVKFHLDTVPGLGAFIEIEAIDFYGTIGAEELEAQCHFYMNLLGINDIDLIKVSYSDMLLTNLKR